METILAAIMPNIGVAGLTAVVIYLVFAHIDMKKKLDNVMKESETRTLIDDKLEAIRVQLTTMQHDIARIEARIDTQQYSSLKTMPSWKGPTC